MSTTNEETREMIEELYNQLYANMIAMIKKDVLCCSIAEDIIQDTFCEATRNAEKLSTHENPGGWLMETAKLKMLTLKRKMNRRSAKEIDELQTEILGMEADYGLVELSHLMESTLNEHEIMLLHKYYFEGYSAKELAEWEHITENNFKVKMFRIRKKLQDALGAKKP